MAGKKVVFSEPAGYFPPSVLKDIEKGAAKKKPAAKKKKTVKRK